MVAIAAPWCAELALQRLENDGGAAIAAPWCAELALQRLVVPSEDAQICNGRLFWLLLPLVLLLQREMEERNGGAARARKKGAAVLT